RRRLRRRPVAHTALPLPDFCLVAAADLMQRSHDLLDRGFQLALLLGERLLLRLYQPIEAADRESVAHGLDIDADRDRFLESDVEIAALVIGQPLEDRVPEPLEPLREPEILGGDPVISVLG